METVVTHTRKVSEEGVQRTFCDWDLRELKAFNRRFDMPSQRTLQHVQQLLDTYRWHETCGGSTVCVVCMAREKLAELTMK